MYTSDVLICKTCIYIQRLKITSFRKMMKITTDTPVSSFRNSVLAEAREVQHTIPKAKYGMINQAPSRKRYKRSPQHVSSQ